MAALVLFILWVFHDMKDGSLFDQQMEINQYHIEGEQNNSLFPSWSSGVCSVVHVGLSLPYVSSRHRPGGGGTYTDARIESHVLCSVCAAALLVVFCPVIWCWTTVTFHHILPLSAYVTHLEHLRHSSAPVTQGVFQQQSENNWRVPWHRVRTKESGAGVNKQQQTNEASFPDRWCCSSPPRPWPGSCPTAHVPVALWHVCVVLFWKLTGSSVVCVTSNLTDLLCGNGWVPVWKYKNAPF